MRHFIVSVVFIFLGTGILSAQQAKGPDGEALAAIKKLGGNVMQVAQNDPRLDVTLHLADGEVTDAALADVAKLGDVLWLNLAGTKITDAGLAQLANLKSLEKLHLEKTDIGDAGL
ncbi:MAG: hypothetical protein KDA80_20955, partial [Planctomycetaceae bacterium]|nr:hypothetical protein [Planctomycetaceae bacterium]